LNASWIALRLSGLEFSKIRCQESRAFGSDFFGLTHPDFTTPVDGDCKGAFGICRAAIDVGVTHPGSFLATPPEAGWGGEVHVDMCGEGVTPGFVIRSEVTATPFDMVKLF